MSACTSARQQTRNAILTPAIVRRVRSNFRQFPLLSVWRFAELEQGNLATGGIAVSTAAIRDVVSLRSWAWVQAEAGLDQ